MLRTLRMPATIGRPARKMIASLSAMVGLFLERHLLVVPSLSPDRLNIGLTYLLVTAAFALLFIAIYSISIRRMRPVELTTAEAADCSED